jgi:hypothetical protein
MGTMKVTLEDENGKRLVQILEQIGEPLNRGMSKAVGPRFPWTSTIDPYGDTTFNHIQAELLRKEWAILIQEAEDEKTKDALLQVDEVLQRCVSERLYVKFYGD